MILWLKSGYESLQLAQPSTWRRWYSRICLETALEHLFGHTSVHQCWRKIIPPLLLSSNLPRVAFFGRPKSEPNGDRLSGKHDSSHLEESGGDTELTTYNAVYADYFLILFTYPEPLESSLPLSTGWICLTGSTRESRKRGQGTSFPGSLHARLPQYGCVPLLEVTASIRRPSLHGYFVVWVTGKSSLSLPIQS